MNRNKLFLMITMIIMLSSFGILSQPKVLSEDFSGLSQSNGSTDVSSSLDSKLQTKGWTGSKIFENAGAAKLGSTSSLGYITTKTVDLSGNDGKATLSVDIQKYSSDSKVVKVYHAPDGVTFTQIGSDITPTTSPTTVTIDITGGTANSKIKISASNASSGRFYLDNLLIVQNKTVPTVSTNSIGNISYNSANCGGNVTVEGASSVTAKGVCWSINSNPSIQNDKTNDGSGLGAFTSIISNLNPETKYYVRAYATNNSGTSYGDEVSFTTTKNTSSYSSTSDIVANSSISYLTNIDYKQFLGNSVTVSSPELFRFDIRDGGSSADDDAVGTILNSISFNVTNFSNLNKLALYDGDTKISEVSSASTITFNNLTLQANDGEIKTLSIRAMFNNSVVDNSQIAFTIASVTADANGSQFATANAGAASSSTLGDNNRVEVIATKLAFTTQPSSSASKGLILAQQPIVSALDENLNIDVDYVSTITLSNSASLAMSNYTQNVLNGIAAFSNFSINQSGNNVNLSASDLNFTSEKSNAITITEASNTGTSTVSQTSLYDFGNCYADNFSDAQYFTVSASGLSNDLTITAPANFVVSTNYKTAFSSSLVLTQTSGTVSTKKVFVRYKPTTVGENSGNVTISGASAVKTVSVSGTCVSSYVPTNYYSSATGTGAELKTNLYNIIGSHTARSYDNLWTDFQTTDKKFDGKVWDMYSDVPDSTPQYEYSYSTNQCGNYNGEGDCYNREHSFPKSWFNDATPMYTDLYHLVPTDGFVNGKRSNYMFGEVSSPTWTSTNGCKLGSCSYSGYSGTVFEPIDEYKGDFARAYFYMVTCYENKISDWQQNDNDADALLDGTKFPAFETWAMNMLLEWNTKDPVSQKEINRNQAVYKIQGNRNPFIDNSNYAKLIWDKSTTVTPPSDQATNFNCTAITSSSLTISWTRGNGDNVIVVAKKGTSVDSDPATGTSYNSSSSFGTGSQIGSGNYVVYNGNESSVTVTGLNPNTTYYFAVYEYNTSGVCYNTVKLSGNATTNSNATSVVSNLEQVNDLVVYPNPTNDYINISLSSQFDIANISIYNIAGVEVINTNINKNNSKINVSNLSSGVYSLKIKTKDKVYTNKFVKK